MKENNINENNITEKKNLNKKEYEYIFDYEIKEKIGEGAFSKVKLGIHITTKKKVAIKIISKFKLTKNEEIRLKREIQILNKLNHPNIIKIYEIKEDKNNFYLIMEYYSEGDLYKFISKYNKLNEEDASIIFYQIVNGVEYLHNNYISHRDLKLENILIDKKKNVKIIDYNLSNFFLESNGCILKTPCGSPYYTAPEMIKNKSYNAKTVDIWSIGIILYVILCGFLPFEDKNSKRLYQKILNGKVFIPNFLSDIARNIIENLLYKNCTKRYTIKQIKKHPFYIMGEYLYNNKINNNNDNNDNIKENDINDNKNKDINGNNKLNNNKINQKIDRNIDHFLKKNYEEEKLNEILNHNNTICSYSDHKKNILTQVNTNNNRKITVNKKLFKPKEIKKNKNERESSLDLDKKDLFAEHLYNIKKITSIEENSYNNYYYSSINDNKNLHIYSFEEEKNCSFNFSKNNFNNSIRNISVDIPSKNNIRKCMKKFNNNDKKIENKNSSVPKTQRTYLKIKKKFQKNNKITKKMITGYTEKNFIINKFNIKKL